MTANAIPRVAVLLSGCGYLDGAEIRESVFTLTALDRAGAQFEVFSLNKEVDEVNHITGKPTGQKRHLLMDSARIARGKIKDLKDANPKRFDAVILPGGFGVALHFCSFAKDGADCSVDPSVEKFVGSFIEDRKPIGAICIAPALIAKLFANHGGAKLTIGQDTQTAGEIAKLGSTHENKQPWEISVDRDHKLVTTPAYMFDDAKISLVSNGIESLVNQVLLFCTNFSE